MKPYVDYQFYKNEYKGDMPEEDFKGLALIATAKIKANTFNRINENNVPLEVKQCACALVEKLSLANKSSESIGSWSVTYINSSDAKKEIYQIIYDFLCDLRNENGIPLLYRGC